MGTVIVVAILLAAVALVVRSLWRKRKSGGCGCGCEGCSGCDIKPKKQ